MSSPGGRDGSPPGRWRGRRIDRLGVPSLPPLALVVLGALLLGTLGACGVGPQHQPTTLASAGPTWTEPSTGSSPTAGLSIQVFLVRGGHLVQVWRQSSGGQRLSDVLHALLESPSPQDRAAGLDSAIPASVNTLQATVVRGVVRLQVPPPFDALPSRERVLAVAQLVYTLTAQLPVRGLQLMAGSKAVDTPVGSGRLVSRPVTRADFAQLAPSVS